VTSWLAPLADDRGVILGLAIDHRDSFDAVLRERGIDGLGLAGARLQKAAIVGALAPFATAVMLDHAAGSLAIADGACGRAALVMPLEAQGYEALGDERRVALMAGFSPARARDLGAAACKLLVPMRPDRRAFTDAQLDVAATAVRATHAAGLPLILEPLVYRRSDEPEAVFRDGYTDLVVEATLNLAAVGGDLLKLPIPSDGRDGRPPDARSCRRMADACRGLPWVLYGAGLPIDLLTGHLAAAGNAGASGFLVGRTIWADLLDRDAEATAAAATSVGRQRLQRLSETAIRHCRPLAAGPPGAMSPAPAPEGATPRGEP
jgi:tagatose-1,6-bisphosphate aldolase